MNKFFPNKLALIVLISACSIILISMGLRQTFGLFFKAFEEGIGCTRTEFGLAIGIQMLFWGIFAPIFGFLADRFGGSKAVFIGFIIFGLGIYMLYAGPNTGIYFQISLGVLVGTALGATAIGVPVSEVGKHFPNETRTLAYDVSPYDETLILDTDVVICNDVFKQCFNQSHNFLIYRTSYDLADINRAGVFDRISDTSVDFYWATCVFFRKSPANKLFFDLLQHIQENWQHYNNIFQINTPYYRNDYSFAIAIHIMNGYQTGDFAKPMPGVLYYTTDKSILWELDKDELLLLLEKELYKGEYTPLRIKNANVHVMNKFSLNRCIDEQ